MPSDYESGDGRGQRPPKRPPEGEAEGQFEDPWFVDPEPIDESRRPPGRERATGEDSYLPPDYEDFGAGHDAPRERSRTLPVVIALLALLGFAGLLWYAYSWGGGPADSGEVPVVTADEAPAKVAPEEPGGMEIPNQDKQVLNGEGATTNSDVERLLPPPEEPKPPQLTTQPAPAAPTEQSPPLESTQSEPDAGLATEAPDAPAPSAAAAPETTTVAQEASDAASQGVEQQAAQAEQQEEPAPAPEAPAQLADAPPGAFVMQLASVRSEDTARSEWQRMQGKHEALLGDMQLFIQQVELEGRGTYYRIQTGPFPSRSTAQDLCAQLKAAGQDCLVTQR